MGKISDYLEQVNHARAKAQEQSERQTVADFAAILNKTSDVLLKQLHDAGVQKTSELDRITEKDKKSLLNFLQQKHGSPARKRITVVKQLADARFAHLLTAVLEQKNGAEWECLNQFTGEVIAGHPIPPNLQEVVNLIVAKAIMCEALPQKVQGRPKTNDADAIGEAICQKYYDLRDRGASYSEVVSQIAVEIHRDERHVMRIVKKYKETVGLTLEDRTKKRVWAEFLRNPKFGTIHSTLFSVLEQCQNPQPPELTGQDYIDYLDERIVTAASAGKPTDIK